MSLFTERTERRWVCRSKVVSLIGGVVTCTLSPILMFGVHVLGSRFARGFNRLAMAALSFILAMPLSFALPARRVLPGRLCFLLVYWSLGYVYLNIFNMGETARRVRLLLEIAERGTASDSELAGSYGIDEIIDNLLGRLCEMGEAELVDGRYRLKGKILWRLAPLLGGLRGLLGMRGIGGLR